MSTFEQFIDKLNDQEQPLAKTELKALIANAKQDDSQFVRLQAENIEHWTLMLVNGDISAAGYKKLIKKMEILADLETLKLDIETKIRAQSLAESIRNIVIKQLFCLI